MQRCQWNLDNLRIGIQPTVSIPISCISGQRNWGRRGRAATPFGIGALPLPSWIIIEEILWKFCCLKVEILLNGVAVDSLDTCTHCCDHLYSCCCGYLCYKLINDNPTIFSCPSSV